MLLFVYALSLQGTLAVWKQDLKRIAEATPRPVDFHQYFEALPTLGRPLRLCAPCIGVDGCGHACQSMNLRVDLTDAFDLEDGYRSCLFRHFEDLGMEHVAIQAALHLG